MVGRLSRVASCVRSVGLKFDVIVFVLVSILLLRVVHVLLRLCVGMIVYGRVLYFCTDLTYG